MEKKDNDFSKTRMTFAYVLHASLSDIQKLDKFLNGLEDLRVVYQRCSADRLYIHEEEADNES